MNFRNAVRTITPPFLIDIYRSLGPYQCPLCNKHFRGYFPLPDYYKEMSLKHGYIYDLKDGETLNYEHYLCPACNSIDRERIFKIYIDRVLNENPGKTYDLIDFAPSVELAKWLKKDPRIKYRSADLMMEHVDDRNVDMTNMPLYKDNRFDLFICSHILEHVSDPDAALSELYRITKKGGWGIVMVPIVMGLDETQEDPGITDPDDRYKYYGQEDHLRMFGKKDFIQRIERSGFECLQIGVDFFGEKAAKKAGISPTSVLYIARKNG